MIRRRRRVRVDLLLAVVMVAVVAAALVVRRGSAASSVLAPTSARAAVLAFSRGYLSHLEGGLPASALAGATGQVRSLAAATIPPSSRIGRLSLASLELQSVSGATSAQAQVSARDGRHSYGFELVLRYLAGAWRVTYLVPVDLATVLAPPYRPVPTPVAVRLAARRFALTYADFRERGTQVLPAGLPAIRRQLAAGQDPLATTSPTHSSPQLVALTFGPVAQGSVAVSATESARGSRLRFGFDLELAAGRWQASGFSEASR